MPYILKTNLPTDPVVAVGDDINFEEKLLYGGENIALGDEVFIWFTENRGTTDRPKGPSLAGIGVCFDRNLDGGRIRITLGHCQTNWPGAEEAIIEDSQGAS